MSVTSKKDSLNITAIVLAGGKSSRMGRDKALITIDGTPLLSKICNIAKQLGNRLSSTPKNPIYIVTPWPEKYQNLVPNDCEFIQEVLTPGETKSHGPLIGFSQGLAYLEKQELSQIDWVLLLACDLPQLRLDILEDWVLELENVEEEVIACLPKHPKGWEPLCGFYRPCCLPELLNYIHRGGRSFQQWLVSQTVRELSLNDPEMLFNCNTTSDLAKLSTLKSFDW